MNLVQELHFEKVSNWNLGFLLKSSKGESVFTPSTFIRGKNKGKQYVTFRETVLYSQKQKFPYVIGGKLGKTICGFRILDNFLGWSYTDINGHATILHTDFENFLDVLIFDSPKEKSFEVFSQYISENKICQTNEKHKSHDDINLLKKENEVLKEKLRFQNSTENNDGKFMTIELREPMHHFSYRNMTTIGELLAYFDNSWVVLDNKIYEIKSNGTLIKLKKLSKKEQWSLQRVRNKHLEEVNRIKIDEFESECTVFLNSTSTKVKGV